jgi:hypothetical protein
MPAGQNWLSRCIRRHLISPCRTPSPCAHCSYRDSPKTAAARALLPCEAASLLISLCRRPSALCLVPRHGETAAHRGRRNRAQRRASRGHHRPGVIEDRDAKAQCLWFLCSKHYRHCSSTPNPHRVITDREQRRHCAFIFTTSCCYFSQGSHTPLSWSCDRAPCLQCRERRHQAGDVVVHLGPPTSSPPASPCSHRCRGHRNLANKPNAIELLTLLNVALAAGNICTLVMPTIY